MRSHMSLGQRSLWHTVRALLQLMQVCGRTTVRLQPSVVRNAPYANFIFNFFTIAYLIFPPAGRPYPSQPAAGPP